MKKFFIALIMVAICAVAAEARDEVYRDVSVLPQTAQKFIRAHFKKLEISIIKVDKTLGFTKDYEVKFTDGTEIDFDSDGVWDKIDMPRTKDVPSTVVPKAIAQYVGKNFPGHKIVSIDKESRTYEVELQNGLDLVFDRAGNFKRIED